MGNDPGAIRETIEFNAHDAGLSEPQVGEWIAVRAVQMLAELQVPAAGARDDDRKVVALMRCSVTQAGTIREGRVFEER